MPKVYEVLGFLRGDKIIGGTTFKVESGKMIVADDLISIVEESKAFQSGNIMEFTGSLDGDNFAVLQQAQLNELKFLFDGGLIDKLRKLPEEAKSLIRNYAVEVVDEYSGAQIDVQITADNENTIQQDPDATLGDSANNGTAQKSRYTDDELQKKSVAVLTDLIVNEYKISADVKPKTPKAELISLIKAYYSAQNTTAQ